MKNKFELFDRIEIKKECNVADCRKLFLKLKKLGFIQQKFFNKLDHTYITNIAYDVCNYKNQDFNNYLRIRIRRYHEGKKKDSKVWIELRQRKENQVFKKRFPLANQYFKQFIQKKNLVKIIPKKYKKDYLELFKKSYCMVPYFVIDYKRYAWNKGSMRVTIDQDLRYYSIDYNKDFLKGRLIGKDDFAIVKFKTIDNFPLEIKKIINSLKEPRSKMKQGLKYAGLLK